MHGSNFFLQLQHEGDQSSVDHCYLRSRSFGCVRDRTTRRVVVLVSSCIRRSRTRPISFMIRISEQAMYLCTALAIVSLARSVYGGTARQADRARGPAAVVGPGLSNLPYYDRKSWWITVSATCQNHPECGSNERGGFLSADDYGRVNNC